MPRRPAYKRNKYTGKTKVFASTKKESWGGSWFGLNMFGVLGSTRMLSPGESEGKGSMTEWVKATFRRVK